MPTPQPNPNAPPKPTPTVVYDTENPPSSPLLSPDLPRLLKQKRVHHVFPLGVHLPRAAQMGVTGVSLVLSALQANGVYSWATYGPVVARDLELTGTQAQTIVVGGILGVYLCAAPLGALTDKYGPRGGSLVSAFLSALGYLSFAVVLRTQPTWQLSNVHIYLAASFFAVGAATVGAYFSVLTCASLSFPSHPTLSLSVPLSLVGLSSLVLSSFSNLPAFQTHSGELNPVAFLFFLGTLSPCINLLGALFMRVVPQTDTDLGEEYEPEPDIPSVPALALPDAEDEESITHTPAMPSRSQSHSRSYRDGASEAGYGTASVSSLRSPSSPIGQLLHLDEHTPLLIGGPEAAREDAEAIGVGKHVDWTVVALVNNHGFWVFGGLLALSIGPAETVIASIGSILTSLLPRDLTAHLGSLFAAVHTSPFSIYATLSQSAPNALVLRNKHVFILSICSTLARLFTGVAADYLAPPPSAVPAPLGSDPTQPPHIWVQEKPVRMRRSTFAAIASLVLALVFGWSAVLLDDEGGMWVLSAGVGLMYGTLFTLTPAIVSTHYGPTNFGLAWGMISYFPAIGSVVFSYIYANLAEAASPDPTETCYGTKCFQPTLAVATACCALSGVGLFVLGRRWKL